MTTPSEMQALRALVQKWREMWADNRYNEMQRSTWNQVADELEAALSTPVTKPVGKARTADSVGTEALSLTASEYEEDWYCSSVVQDDNGQTFIATVGNCPVNETDPDALHYEDTVYQVLGVDRGECEGRLAFLMGLLLAPPPPQRDVRAPAIQASADGVTEEMVTQACAAYLRSPTPRNMPDDMRAAILATGLPQKAAELEHMYSVMNRQCDEVLNERDSVRAQLSALQGELAKQVEIRDRWIASNNALSRDNTKLDEEIAGLRTQLAALQADGERWRRDANTALDAAKQKLELYRAGHSGEYIGGMEYTQLIKLIDTARTTG